MKDEIEFRAAWLAGDHISESLDCQKIKAEAHIKQLPLLNSGCPGFLKCGLPPAKQHEIRFHPSYTCSNFSNDFLYLFVFSVLSNDFYTFLTIFSVVQWVSSLSF
jgi:hypothetical protein